MGKGLKPIHYYDEMWRRNVCFCIGWSPGAFKKWLLDNYGCDDDTIWQHAGMCYYLERKKDGHIQIIIWVRYKTGPRMWTTLHHECIHAALHILDGRVTTTANNSETLCYLVDLLVEKATEK